MKYNSKYNSKYKSKYNNIIKFLYFKNKNFNDIKYNISNENENENEHNEKNILNYIDNNEFYLSFSQNLNNFIKYLYVNNLIVKEINNNCKNKKLDNISLNFILYSYNMYINNTRKLCNLEKYIKIDKYFNCIINNNFKLPKCLFFGWCGNIYNNSNTNFSIHVINTIFHNLHIPYCDICDIKLIHKNNNQILYKLNYIDENESYFNNIWNIQNTHNIIYNNYYNILNIYIIDIILPNINGIFFCIIDEYNNFNIYTNNNLNKIVIKDICHFDKYCYDNI